MPHGEYQRLFGDNFLNYTGTIDFFLDTNLNLRLFFTQMAKNAPTCGRG
jgi:hypothetical protein